jgi:hypothetical protein
MVKPPKDQLKTLVKRRAAAKRSKIGSPTPRGRSLKGEDWYEMAQKRFAISTKPAEAPDTVPAPDAD